MKKIFILLVLLSSIISIDARPKRATKGRFNVVEHAAQLEKYAKLSAHELIDQKKAIEAWDIIGECYAYMAKENGPTDAVTAKAVMGRIQAYRKAERELLRKRAQEKMKKQEGKK